MQFILRPPHRHCNNQNGNLKQPICISTNNFERCTFLSIGINSCIKKNAYNPKARWTISTCGLIHYTDFSICLFPSLTEERRRRKKRWNIGQMLSFSIKRLEKITWCRCGKLHFFFHLIKSTFYLNFSSYYQRLSIIIPRFYLL